MPWSGNEIEKMAAAHFAGGSPRCPLCRAQVIVNKFPTIGSKTVPLSLDCPRCGESGGFSEPHLEEMNLEWTRAQMRSIVDSYWEHGVVRCPMDGTVLGVNATDIIGEPRTSLYIFCERCGRQLNSGEVEEEKKMSPFEEKYEPIRVLNSGGMGMVSLVRSRATGEQLAAKTIKPEYLRDAGMLRRFAREKRVLTSLDHRNVVRIHETFMDETGGVFVMDYMPGGDLGQAITEPKTSRTTLADLFDGIVAGVEYIHAQGITHRDLKPGNVLIDAQGVARVTDFGLAVMNIRDTTPLTAARAGLGTFHYAAPEQLSDAANVTAKADVYALGLIAYEIATRESPYLPPLSVVGDTTFDEVFRRAIARVEQRTATPRELGTALRAFLMRSEQT